MAPDKETAQRLYEMGQELIEMAKMCGYDDSSDTQTLDEEGTGGEESMEEEAPAPTKKPKAMLILALKKRMGK